MPEGRGTDGRLVPDPVSVLFTAGAARLLGRAYEARPRWVATPVAAPTPEHRAWAAQLGIDLDAAQRIGDNDPLNRWLRGFVRRVYYLHRWHYYETIGGLDLERRRMAPADARGVRYEVGRVSRRIPGTRFYGTPVRIRVMAGTGYRRVPPRRRYVDVPDLRSYPEDRDW